MTHPTTEAPDLGSKAEQARAVASTAADEGRHVADVAQEEITKVAGEATAQVRSLADETRTQVSDQVADQTRQQRDKLVSTLGTFGDDLHTMAERAEGGGLAADVAREVAQHTRSLSSYLEGREPGELLDDVRDFARRRPGLFLFGALAAGVVAGRVARGVKDAEPTSSSGGVSVANSNPDPTPAPSFSAPPPPPPPPPPAPGPTPGTSGIPGYSTGPSYGDAGGPPVGSPPPTTPATTAMPTTPPPDFEPGFPDRPGPA